MFHSIVLTLMGVTAALANWCDDIQINGVTNYSISGKYYVHFDRSIETCNDSWMYKHQTRPYYLYFVDDWWIVSDKKCESNGVDTALLRTRTLPIFRKPMAECICDSVVVIYLAKEQKERDINIIL
ncbi:hypothetical protein LSH36_646g01051 [Paralvinella palmiformis]|uniref:Uncharacterized protein n=1 Tax=Paralvinella palmiformis TaxID=53620 RepID=A0AAD9J3E7_9ANNE|nr:hypothetical protein LSH36_646g01051 [Paralvinella palmiformis]